MNKSIRRLLALLLTVIVCANGICTHVHTEECGENGIDCTHECGEFDPNGKPDDPPMM